MEGAATQDDNNVTMKEGSVGVGRHTRTYHQNPHTSRTFHSNLTTLGLFNDVAIQLASLPLGTTHINPSKPTDRLERTTYGKDSGYTINVQT